MSPTRALVAFLTLLGPKLALAGPYQSVTGDILIIVEDPDAVAFREGGGQGLAGWIFGLSEGGVCEKAATEISASLKAHPCEPDPALAQYICPVPAVVDCITYEVAADQQWLRFPSESAAGDVPELRTLAPGSNSVVRIHITDYDSPAIAKTSRATVSIGKALGLSIQGRVNVEIVRELWTEMSKRRITFYAAFL